MAKPKTLKEAMVAGDALAEAEIRYELLAEVFEQMPQLRANINSQLERAKAEIMKLRAAKPKVEEPAGKLMPIDPNRFRKSEPLEGVPQVK